MTMEHIYTIKVKRHFDPRGLYPSERRYSASTVYGLAWLHLALAATAFLLACLALINPTPATVLTKDEHHNFPTEFLLNEIKHNEQIQEISSDFNQSEEVIHNEYTSSEQPEILNQIKEEETKEYSHEDDVKNIETEDGTSYPLILALAPTLVAAGGLVAGLAAILASKKWYMDHNITWFFLTSLLAAILSLISLCMIITWIISASESGLSFCDYFSDGNLFGKIKVIRNIDEEFSNTNSNGTSNNTWYYIIKVPVDELRNKNIPLLGDESKESKTRKVLSINILIASAVEIIWSILSIRIAWRGMRADYPDDDSADNRRGGTVHVVTEIKGNNTKYLPKNTKILPPQPDLIEHYPKDNKIKKFFQLQQENGGFFLKANQTENGFMVIGPDDAKSSDLPRRENSAEYKDRIMNFLNRCSEQSTTDEVVSPVSLPDEVNPNPNLNPPNQPSDNFQADRSFASVTIENPDKVSPVTDRVSLASWGDNLDYTVYNQNTLDFNKIMLNFDRRKEQNNQDIDKEETVNNISQPSDTTENESETPLNELEDEKGK